MSHVKGTYSQDEADQRKYEGNEVIKVQQRRQREECKGSDNQYDSHSEVICALIHSSTTISREVEILIFGARE